VRVRELGELEDVACGCNDAVRRHFDEVLEGVYPDEEESSALKAAAGDSRPGARMGD
jgi:hypothetical protein